MDETIIKAISEGGIGIGSMIIMGVVFVFQMKTNQKINESNIEIMTRMGNKLDEHSQIMRESVIEIREGRKADIEVLKTLQGCKHNQFKS